MKQGLGETWTRVYLGRWESVGQEAYLEGKNAARDVLKGGHICRQALFSSWYVVLFLVFQRTLITQGILS